MTVGSGGKYDSECEALLLKLSAGTVFLCVINGERGTGFSITTLDPRQLLALTETLRSIADEVDRDAAAALELFRSKLVQ